MCVKGTSSLQHMHAALNKPAASPTEETRFNGGVEDSQSLYIRSHKKSTLKLNSLLLPRIFLLGLILSRMGLRLNRKQLLVFKVVSQQFGISNENNCKSSYRNYICFGRNQICLSPTQTKLSFHSCADHFSYFSLFNKL